MRYNIIVVFLLHSKMIIIVNKIIVRFEVIGEATIGAEIEKIRMQEYLAKLMNNGISYLH